MGKDILKYRKTGNMIELSREQWAGNHAYISDYPGLLEEVQKYTWTYGKGEHPYLRSSKLNMSLHYFVLSFLYGKENLDQMRLPDNIIEHLDNNGLNCCYDNLHILSSDWNKAKAFTIDKEADQFDGIPSFVTDVYYSHNRKYYQMQIVCNRDIYYCRKSQRPVESFAFQYNGFNNLFIDWLYVYECRDSGRFDITKFHADRMIPKPRPDITIKPEEEGHTLICRDGEWYLVLRPDDEKSPTFISKTAYENLEDI